MKFRNTLKGGLLVTTRFETQLHKSYDTHVTILVEAGTLLLVWGFHEFTEDEDMYCKMEIDLLLNAEIWSFPLPRESEFESEVTWDVFFAVPEK